MSDQANPIQSLLEAFTNRLRNPFTGSVLLFFVSFNWKAIYVLILSSDDFSVRFDLAAQYSVCQGKYGMPVVLPILASFGYLVIIPFILFVIEWIVKKIVTSRRLLKKSQEKDVLEKSREVESLKYQLNNIEQWTKYEEETRQGLVDLKMENKELQATISNQLQDLEVLRSERNSYEKSIAIIEETNKGIRSKHVDVLRTVNAQLFNREMLNKDIEKLKINLPNNFPSLIEGIAIGNYTLSSDWAKKLLNLKIIKETSDLRDFVITEYGFQVYLNYVLVV